MATATPDLNSYVTLAEATAYFETRYGYIDAWLAQTTAQQNAALISAFALVNMSCEWFGRKTDDDQVGEFPRNGATEAPQGIKDAQCEIAFSFVEAGSANVGEEDVLTSLKAGDVELGFKGIGGKTGGPYSNYTKLLLGQFGLCNFGHSMKSVDVLRS